MDQLAWDERYGTAELLWSAEPNRFVAEELSDLAPGRALDLAAGEGRNAVWLARRGWFVTAVDFSRVAIERCRRSAEAAGVHLRLVTADLRTFLPDHRFYDMVLVSYLHLPAPQRRLVLDRAADAVAPGGTLLVVAHDLDNIERGWGGPQDPAVLCGPEDVAAEIRGLVVERAERVDRPVMTPDGRRVDAIDHVVRAVRPALSALEAP